MRNDIYSHKSIDKPFRYIKQDVSREQFLDLKILLDIAVKKED